MKKNLLILALAAFSFFQLKSQNYSYYFGYGINTLDPTTSKVFKLGLSRKIKPKLAIGFLSQFSIDETISNINAYNRNPLSVFERNYDFAFSELLDNGDKIGIIKLRSYKLIHHEYFFGTTLNFISTKSRFTYISKIGLGALFYNMTGVATSDHTAFSLEDSEKKEVTLYTNWYQRGLSLAFIFDQQIEYKFDNDMFIGLSLSLDYDPFLSGFPFKSTLLIGKKF